MLAEFSWLRKFTRSLLPVSILASGGLFSQWDSLGSLRLAQVFLYPEGLSVSLSLKTAELAWSNLLLARGDFESPVCFHVNLDSLVQSSGKLTNQKGRGGYDLRPNVHCNEGAGRLLSIALVKPWGIPHWRCFLLDSTDIYPAPTKCQALHLGLGTEKWRDVVPAHRKPTVYCDYLVMGFSTGENTVAFSWCGWWCLVNRMS